MTVQEAIQQTQGKGVGIMNRASAQYAQTLILQQERIQAAVVANITTRGARFPGVVVMTDRRVLAVCGMPGIKRSVVIELDQLEKCEEAPSALHYKAAFSDGKTAFTLTIDPEIGEKFSRQIAILNGEEEAFDAVSAGPDDGIFNPVLVRSKIRKRRAQQKEREKRRAEQEEIREQRESRKKARAERNAPAETESAKDVAQRLARQLDEAKAKGRVEDTDPQAIAARLAAELAAEEERGGDSQ